MDKREIAIQALMLAITAPTEEKAEAEGLTDLADLLTLLRLRAEREVA